MERVLRFLSDEKAKHFASMYDCKLNLDADSIELYLVDITIEDVLHNSETHNKLLTNCQNLLNKTRKKELPEYYLKDIETVLTYLLKGEYKELLSFFDNVLIEADSKENYIAQLKNNLDFLKEKSIIIYAYMSKKGYNEAKEYYLAVKEILPNNRIQGVVPKNDIYPEYFCDIEDYFKAYEKFFDIVNLVKNLNLSPAEEVEFVYDLIKKRQYKIVEEDPWYTSRGLINVLIGDKIVCAGYIELFKAIIEDLGHCYVRQILIKNTEKNKIVHVIASIYIKDEKYNINGNYLFDITFDTKEKEENADKACNKYEYFMRTLEEMDYANKNRNREISDYPFLIFLDRICILNTLPEIFTREEYVKAGGKAKHNTFLVDMCEKEYYIKDEGNKKEDLENVYNYIVDSFNKYIKYWDIANLFYNVRKIEYYLDPKNMPFSVNDMHQMIKSHCFAPHCGNLRFFKCIPEELMNQAIDNKIDDILEKYLPNVEQDIERIKLTRTLRNYLIKRQGE